MIDYSILANSVQYYDKAGFQRIESPWTVTSAISDITRPKDKKAFELKHEDNKVLVASGEQSFLYLFAKGFLPHGMYQTITPCFRSDSFDDLHTKYFVKNELIDTKTVTTDRLDAIVNVAFGFFKQYFPEKDLKITGNGITSDAYDIEYKGIELGSYGIRSCPFLEWIYATGVAEPRLSSTVTRFVLAKRDDERFNSC